MPEIKALGILVVLFVILLLGTTFMGVLGDNIEANSALQSTNESIAIASGTGTTANDEVVSVAWFGNATNSTDSSIINFNTEVNFTEAGVITVSMNVTEDDLMPIFADGNYYIAYTYEGDQYVDNSTARVLLSLVLIFFALYLVVKSVEVVKKSFPDLF